MAMISSPNIVGLRTSMAASRMISSLGRVPPSCASRRTQFSIMITLESTIRPKSIAPRLIRLAEIPGRQHHVGGEEHRERDRQRHDQAAAQVSQQHQQDHHDQDAAGRQVVQDRTQVWSIRWVRS